MGGPSFSEIYSRHDLTQSYIFNQYIKNITFLITVVTNISIIFKITDDIKTSETIIVVSFDVLWFDTYQFNSKLNSFPVILIKASYESNANDDLPPNR